MSPKRVSSSVGNHRYAACSLAARQLRVCGEPTMSTCIAQYLRQPLLSHPPCWKDLHSGGSWSTAACVSTVNPIYHGELYGQSQTPPKGGRRS